MLASGESSIVFLLMIRSITNSNRRNESALFSILKDATFDLRELEGEELADRAKYAELVMKVCISHQ